MAKKKKKEEKVNLTENVRNACHCKTKMENVLGTLTNGMKGLVQMLYGSQFRYFGDFSRGQLGENFHGKI